MHVTMGVIGRERRYGFFLARLWILCSHSCRACVQLSQPAAQSCSYSIVRVQARARAREYNPIVRAGSRRVKDGDVIHNNLESSAYF